MVIVQPAVAVALVESTTAPVKLKAPWTSGVPVIAPVLELSVRSEGKLPALMEYAYGGIPPDATRAEA